MNYHQSSKSIRIQSIAQRKWLPFRLKKVNEKLVYTNLQDRRDRQQPKFKLGQLVRTADIKRVFSKGDSTNYSYKLYTITEIIHGTISWYRIDILPERSNEIVILHTKLSLEWNNQFMKKLNLVQYYDKYWLELTEDEIIKKYAKHCGHCNWNILLPYENEWTFISCGFNLIRRKHEFSEIQRNKVNFINRLRYAELKIFCICLDVYKTKIMFMINYTKLHQHLKI